VSNQDIDGRVPPEASTGAPAAPGTLEQQLETEREARAKMRDRLRYTEALAAESHALREQMAQELQRVTADRDRLRSEAAAAAAAAKPAASAEATPKPAAARQSEPLFTPTMAPAPATFAADRPLKPPPVRRKGPWAALVMLGVLAAAGAAAAWYKTSLTDEPQPRVATAHATAAPVAPAIRAASSSAQTMPSPAPAAASVAVATTAPPSSAVALPPLSPEAQLAAAPTAAGPPTAGMPARLRKALDGEGIASAVDVDAATGHVMVSDPQADDALRQRTEMVIRAVYAGASLPEPQIEHRWLSPMRGARETTASADAATAPAPAVASTQDATTSSTHPASLRAGDHRKATTAAALTESQALTPVLPAGRLTEACMQDIAGKTGGRRAALTSCMKRSCCSSSANHNSEECRAYDKAYPFACGG
jgi:hypothetical protein